MDCMRWWWGGLDEAGNLGVSRTLDLVLDTTPADVLNGSWYIGSQPLVTQGGFYRGLLDRENTVFFKSLGGAKRVTFRTRKKQARGLITSNDVLGTIDDTESGLHSMVRDDVSGLWKGGFRMLEEGEYELSVVITDASGEETVRRLGDIRVSGRGSLVDAETNELVKIGKLTVYSASGREWDVWESEPDGQENPVAITRGTFSFMLPAGEYYIRVATNEYRSLVSDVFTMDRTGIFSPRLMLKAKKSLFGFPLPQLFDDRVEIATSDLLLENGEDHVAFGTNTASTLGPEWFTSGNYSLVTIVDVWSSAALEQIGYLIETFSASDYQGVVVLVGDSDQIIDSVLSRGSIRFPVIRDVGGDISQSLGVNTMPTHMLVDGDGYVVGVYQGVLEEGGLRGFLKYGE